MQRADKNNCDSFKDSTGKHRPQPGRISAFPETIMSFDKKRMMKRIIGIAAAAVVTASVTLLLLRAAYALTMFRGLSGNLERAGWTSDTTDSVMQVGETLTFEASYLFFKIGRVNMEVLGKTVYDGVPAYHVRAAIDSYSGIPFVNLHAVYDTYQDAKTFMCLATDNVQKNGSDSVYTSYDLEFKKKILDWRRWKNGSLIEQAEVPLDRHYTDGLSFFYYIREACRRADGMKKSLSIPIIVDTVRSKVDITIDEKRSECKVPAFEYPLQAYKLSGHMNFTGFFGVTGDFTGWVSADSAEVPLRGDVSVIIGSVVVKLKNVQRAGWFPPRSDN